MSSLLGRLCSCLMLFKVPIFLCSPVSSRLVLLLWGLWDSEPRSDSLAAPNSAQAHSMSRDHFILPHDSSRQVLRKTLKMLGKLTVGIDPLWAEERSFTGQFFFFLSYSGHQVASDTEISKLLSNLPIQGFCQCKHSHWWERRKASLAFRVTHL